jgi:hypothetical protein
MNMDWKTLVISPAVCKYEYGLENNGYLTWSTEETQKNVDRSVGDQALLLFQYMAYFLTISSNLAG